MRFLGLLRAYEDLYAALYSSSLHRWRGDAYMASFTTASALSGAVVMNAGLIIGVIVAWTGPLTHLIPEWSILVLVGGTFIVNYRLFIHDDRHQELLRRFQARPNEDQRRRARIGVLYLAASYLIPIAFAAAMVRWGGVPA